MEWTQWKGQTLQARKLQVIHPFPARMAPEIALQRIASMEKGMTLLDPMCGSGTVVRAGVEAGLHTIGRDIDPLAVLMADVWANPPARAQLMHDAHHLLDLARDLEGRQDLLPWIDAETSEFIDFWFAEPQRAQLMGLAAALWRTRLKSRRALQVAFSRLIVTKDRGASLARDVSHSRPHRVANEVDFDVHSEFLKSARALGQKMASDFVRGTASVKLGDSRSLTGIPDASVDCVITSPPYLNALDYLRGHRMSLVWMGHTISSLREVRGSSIGTERILDDQSGGALPFISGSSDVIPAKILGWTSRYLRDAGAVSTQLARVLRRGGDVVLVVGNSRLKGLCIDNAGIYQQQLERAGLVVSEIQSREIPAQNRYLPTPMDGSTLSTRMRTEIVISASKPERRKGRSAA